MRRTLILFATFAAACSGTTVDKPIPATACGATEHIPSRGAGHVMEPEVIDYLDTPPSSGNHRPQWGKWGEYTAMPPERWLHNLEHGGAAFIFETGDPNMLASKLRDYAKARPDDDGGAFRYILTPYTGLPRRIAVITWEWTYQADEVCPAEIDAFLNEHYRMSSEDISADGAFETNWVGR